MRRSLLPDAMSVRVPLEDGFIRLGAGRKARASHVMGETAASDAWCVADMRGGGRRKGSLFTFPNRSGHLNEARLRFVIVLSHLSRLEILSCALPCLDGSVKLLGSLCLRVDAQSADRIWCDSERFLKPEEILHGVTCRVGRVTAAAAPGGGGRWLKLCPRGTGDLVGRQE